MEEQEGEIHCCYFDRSPHSVTLSGPFFSSFSSVVTSHCANAAVEAHTTSWHVSKVQAWVPFPLFCLWPSLFRRVSVSFEPAEEHMVLHRKKEEVGGGRPAGPPSAGRDGDASL